MQSQHNPKTPSALSCDHGWCSCPSHVHPGTDKGPVRRARPNLLISAPCAAVKHELDTIYTHPQQIPLSSAENGPNSVLCTDRAGCGAGGNRAGSAGGGQGAGRVAGEGAARSGSGGARGRQRGPAAGARGRPGGPGQLISPCFSATDEKIC